MEYSSSSSQGSPEELKYYSHEHPLLSYGLWKLDQKRLNNTSFSKRDYIVCVTDHPVKSDLFQTLRDKKCDCYVFGKIRKCLHVLNFVDATELHQIIQREIDCSIRSMLSFPADISSVLEEINLIGQNEDQDILSNFLICYKCKRLYRDLSKPHQCSPEMIGTKVSWRCKLPFLCDELKINLTPDTIMLGPNELHLLIPFVLRVYDVLDVLKIRTSLIQIVAQDPKYQKTLAILESRNMVDEFFTYHLYLYIRYRLLPYLERLNFSIVREKIIPIFTVIRSANDEASKDVIGFYEDDEIKKRLEDCPDHLKNKVKEVFSDMNVDYEDEETKVEQFMKNIIQDGFLTTFSQEWCYVLKCLDVKRSVYKGIRRYVNEIKDKDDDTWYTHSDFLYGRQDREIGVKLTNIFGVLPQHRIPGNRLKRAFLLSREKYTCKEHMLAMCCEKLHVELEKY